MSDLSRHECSHGHLDVARSCKKCHPVRYEINKEMVFSSAHIPETTSKLLESGDAPFSVTSNDYSWRIHVAQNSAVHQVKDNEELRNIAKIAKDYGCLWLVIDQDGPVYDGLPIFEW